jgi:hypothetical protein
MERGTSLTPAARRQSMQEAGRRRVRHDIALVGVNLAVLALAVQQGWSLLALLWPYWLQSLLIGFYARRRIVAIARSGRVPGLQPAAADCFVLHYGLFHLAQLAFLVAFTAMSDSAPLLPARAADAAPMLASGIGPGDWLLFGLLGVLYARVHRAGHRSRIASERAAQPSPLLLLFLPYARVLPMQLALVVVMLNGMPTTLVGAVLLKTALDLLCARGCHRLLTGGPPAAAAATRAV